MTAGGFIYADISAWGGDLEKKWRSQLVQISVWKGLKGGFKMESCVNVCVHKKGVKYTLYNKMCGMGIFFLVFVFLFVLGV